MKLIWTVRCLNRDCEWGEEGESLPTLLEAARRHIDQFGWPNHRYELHNHLEKQRKKQPR
ncbi:MAG: hypothetical protein JO189_10320 [Deltaproteobacteria bacterium]|nr:hypothetical protein [Deltaproteobacteria bacterium]